MYRMHPNSEPERFIHALAVGSLRSARGYITNSTFAGAPHKTRQIMNRTFAGAPHKTRQIMNRTFAGAPQMLLRMFPMLPCYRFGKHG